MEEQTTAQKVAAFRFQVISELLDENLAAAEKAQRIRALSVVQREIPGKLKVVTVSESSIRRWLDAYRQGGFDALIPHKRCDLAIARSISLKLQEIIVKLKKENPQRTVPIILKELHLAGYIDEHSRLNRSTLYRFLESQGLKDKDLHPAEDRRKFAFPNANDLWQADSARGPNIFDEALGRVMHTYLIAFVDDCTRVIPHAQFYYQENCQNLEHAFRQAILKRGIPQRLFVDNGAAFIAKRMNWICSCLNIALIHCRPYSPASKGKIERLIRTIREGFLNYVDTSKIKTLYDLNSRLWAWIEGEYHKRKHQGTEQVPIDHFFSFAHKIRYIPKEIDLDKLFMIKTTRQVYQDRTIRIEGKFFEVPSDFVGKKIAVGYLQDDLSKVFLFDLKGNPLGEADRVDIYVNRLIRRENKRSTNNEDPSTSISEMDSGINFVELMYSSYLPQQKTEEAS